MAGHPMIDIYCHIYPEKFFAEMSKMSPQSENLGKRLRTISKLFDLGERFREMDSFGDYRQIISLPNPPIEDIAEGPQGTALARIANDAMAELCAKHADRFAGFVAAVSLTDIDGSLGEIERAIDQLGACGIQMFTPLAGRPLDEPAFAPVFAAMARHDLPIWLHPARTAAMTDYPSEPKSRFEMWWCFGWPYDTSVAMSWLVFSGLFDRHPGLKVITHHCGGMIPYFDGRVGPGLEVLGARTSGEDYSKILPSLRRPHLEYFKEFYGDTAMFAGKYGIPCGVEFFGTNHIVFATDTPLGPIAPTIAVINQLDIDEGARRNIYAGNAMRLIKRE